MSAYKFQVLETIEALDEIEGILYTRMLNLATEGELKEISDSFEIGDVVPFKYEDLKNIQDPNVNLLMNIFNDVVNAKEKFKNLFPDIKAI
ncbi:hypothetical protein FYC62_01570 [Pedobacter aquae]|uniref:Uncharacterized protein n=1 Tax=Pedobacter aquae TaxID=2605747 RepID=A0A5C0VEJ1_9SPHI|nr:hypothetical protein [Pedobacter aquae]QEK50499.1 hypothetical protein FYC62_01570 [Pedobacter aquae]